MSQRLPCQDLERRLHLYWPTGYGGVNTPDPLYLVAYECKVFPTKHHSVFQRLIHQQLSIKKLWRTHYIAAHDHLTDRLNKYDDWEASFQIPSRAAEIVKHVRQFGDTSVFPKNRDPPAVLHIMRLWIL
jgi:hypothetical protein